MAYLLVVIPVYILIYLSSSFVFLYGETSYGNEMNERLSLRNRKYSPETYDINAPLKKYLGRDKCVL